MATTLIGCVKVPSEDDRLAALAAEPLSPEYRVAMLATWMSPPYTEVADLVDKQQLDAIGASITSGFSQRMPASVKAWPASYGRRSTIGQGVLSSGRINDFARSQMRSIANSGFDAIMTVRLMPIVAIRAPDLYRRGGTKTVRTILAPAGTNRSTPFSIEVRQSDGQFKLIEREFQLKTMRAHVNIRSVPGDQLLYFDSNVEIACDDADEYLSAGPDSKAVVSACAALLSEQLLSNLERTLKRMIR
ncbi:MAG: hypothetical protein QNJ91_00595 [Gammaproteobacteria bacterium]|nr:hypothetical protein [Gammaproteobacteria bacterium]